jgi:hypothetical protein
MREPKREEVELVEVDVSKARRYDFCSQFTIADEGESHST